MGKGRLEAFSDGVIAILITIMVLELHAPATASLSGLAPLWPTFHSYVLSFVYVGIYWNNHHHLMHAVRTVSGPILWANMHLLFWLSLIPFATSWIGEHQQQAWPVALYGAVLLMNAIAFTILMTLLVRHEGADSTVAHAMGRDFKGKISLALYAVAIAAAFFAPLVSKLIYVLVAMIWLIPDRRVERTLKKDVR